MKISTVMCHIMSLAVLCLTAAPSPVFAAYPEKNITMVVPFSPGGGNDRISRCLDTHSTKAFDKSFVFEYKEGAGGLIGSVYLSNFKPDGYALGNVNAPQIYSYATQAGSPFKLESLTYLFQLSTEPMALVTPKGSAIETWDQFVKFCKDNPGKMSLGLGSGFNSSAGYTSSYLQHELGLIFKPIPFKGGADLMVSLLGNHVMAGISNFSVVLNEKDKFNFIAITGDVRDELVPEAPTLQELGVPISALVRRLIVAPAGMNDAQKKEIIDRFKSVFDTPEMQQEMKVNGWHPDWLAGDELAKVLNDEFKTFVEVMSKQ